MYNCSLSHRNLPPANLRCIEANNFDVGFVVLDDDNDDDGGGDNIAVVDEVDGGAEDVVVDDTFFFRFFLRDDDDFTTVRCFCLWIVVDELLLDFVVDCDATDLAFWIDFVVAELLLMLCGAEELSFTTAVVDFAFFFLRFKLFTGFAIANVFERVVDSDDSWRFRLRCCVVTFFSLLELDKESFSL